jgi:hypothetical protein
MLMLFIGTLCAHPGKLEVRNLRTCPKEVIYNRWRVTSFLPDDRGVGEGAFLWPDAFP